MKQIFIFILIINLFGCAANHKGTIKPNSMLADFDKYEEGYYLSINQINIGDEKDVVINEYGSNYKKEINEGYEVWVFKSYRATAATDPIDKLVYVEFANNKVIDIREEYLNGVRTTNTIKVDPAIRIRQLKSLYDDGIISETDYEIKKQELLKQM